MYEVSGRCVHALCSRGIEHRRMRRRTVGTVAELQLFRAALLGQRFRRVARIQTGQRAAACLKRCSKSQVSIKSFDLNYNSSLVSSGALPSRVLSN